MGINIIQQHNYFWRPLEASGGPKPLQAQAPEAQKPAHTSETPEGPEGSWRPVMEGQGRPWRVWPGTWPVVGATVPLAGKAGERPGSTCAIDVEGHKRRPPSKVGRLCHELRV